LTNPNLEPEDDLGVTKIEEVTIKYAEIIPTKITTKPDEDERMKMKHLAKYGTRIITEWIKDDETMVQFPTDANAKELMEIDSAVIHSKVTPMKIFLDSTMLSKEDKQVLAMLENIVERSHRGELSPLFF
jgi:hypothetical protein